MIPNSPQGKSQIRRRDAEQDGHGAGERGAVPQPVLPDPADVRAWDSAAIRAELVAPWAGGKISIIKNRTPKDGGPSGVG